MHPDTTTTYVVQQDICGLVKYDTGTVDVWPLVVNEVNTKSNFATYPIHRPALSQLIDGTLTAQITYS